MAVQSVITKDKVVRPWHSLRNTLCNSTHRLLTGKFGPTLPPVMAEEPAYVGIQQNITIAKK